MPPLPCSARSPALHRAGFGTVLITNSVLRPNIPCDCYWDSNWRCSTGGHPHVERIPDFTVLPVWHSGILSAFQRHTTKSTAFPPVSALLLHPIGVGSYGFSHAFPILLHIPFKPFRIDIEFRSCIPDKPYFHNILFFFDITGFSF